jgi:cytochrome c-type biogenesis protein CcmH/NrfG
MPAPPSALRRRAQHYTDAGRHVEAIACWRDWLAQAPADAEGWYELGWLLRQRGADRDALAAYAQALTHGVREPEQVHVNRAAILSDTLARDAEAEAELSAALAISPDYVPARLNLGKLLEDQGRRAEAIACYRHIVECPAPATAPGADWWADAFARLLELVAAEPDAASWRTRVEQAARGSGGQGNSSRANLWYALGRARETVRDVAGAFAAFTEANRCVAQTAPRYDPTAASARIDSLIAAASACPAGRGDDGTPGPLFICGMFRSGSTLVERVLAAHPAVVAGGELAWFPRLAAGPLAPYPASLARLDDASAAQLAAGYRAYITQLIPPDRPAPRWFTDKRPDNFLLLTLIKRLFPRARIVHTVRNPLDNGLSIWQQHLDPRVAPHATDLAAIGHWYAQYQRLMHHHAACWPDDVLSFDYDAFVADPEPSLRRLLDFLELPWDPACLAFHQRGGAVRTASYLQVRRPLYRDASGRWRAYGERLAPLRDALVAAGVTLPADA